MGPGPSNPYPEATEAFTRPMLGHLDPVFLELLDETCERLRQVWRTTNELTLPVSGTGSAGMEAAFVNLVDPGDVVVVGVNGLFGERMCDVADRCRAEVIRVDAPWGEPLDPEQLVDAHPHPKLIAAVHAETSTGVRNDIAAIGALLAGGADRGGGSGGGGSGSGAVGDSSGGSGGVDGGPLLLADCVTSLGGIPVEIDAWGVDVAYSGTQKCIGVSPGLAPFTMNDKARARRVARPQSWYLDLGMIAQYAATSGARKYHHTAPIAMIVSLHAALGALLEEGLAASHRRHAECGALLQDGLEAMGLTLFAAEGFRLPELTTVWVPDGVDDAKVRHTLLDRYDIEIGGGVGAYAGRVWRIGCMGHTARVANVTLLLAALSEILGR
jgi:alanine-glyoxylate transaminase/serine-glyoxylate transaminase/serine-pyruvate transaminase